MPKLLDITKFCENLQEITSSKIIDKRKFHSAGLFSEQIFGPVKNYTCQCGTYHGISHSGGTCKDCGIDIVNSDVRRKRFAKIVLPIPIVNPIMFDLIIDIGGNLVKNYLIKLMKNDKSVLFVKDDIYYVTDDIKVPEGVQKWEKLEAISELISNIAITSVQDDPNSKWKIVRDNIDKLFIQEILVLPPDLRPASKSIEKNSQVVDEINRNYNSILTKKESMKDTIIDITKDKTLFYSYYKQIQKDVMELYDHIIEKLSKKEGLIRGNILGKRIDFSGRSVIIPDPSLKIDECSLPYVGFLELFKLQVAKKLIELSKFKLLNEAIDFIDDCITLKDPILFKICEELSKKELCILNRQPSLHRLGMLGFKIKISKDSVIKLHPLACSGFNADFDGDQMAVYIPISEETKTEILEKVIITKNLTNPANKELAAIPSQDIILGIYALSTNQFPKLQNIIDYKNTKVTECIKILNECFPEDYPLVDWKVGKKELLKILNDIKEKYSDEMTGITLDKIKEVGFKYSTIYGPSLSLESFGIKNSGKIRDEIYKDGTVMDQLFRLNSKETEDFLKQNFKYSYLIESGARGSWEQAKQIVFSRGYVSDFNGMIKENPIKHSLLEGLDPDEFFNSTYGCRKGLLDVALNTGTSGYLSRKLIFTGTNLELSEDLDDCGTDNYLDVFVEDDKKSRMLLDRYYYNNGVLEKITKENRTSLIGQTIKLRSPLFCKSEQLCHKCYGDLYQGLHSRFVGVIAAQSLGETNVQLILRVFHNSGVAKVGKRDETNENTDGFDPKQKDIVGDLTLAARLFHQTKGKTYKELTEESYQIYNRSRDIHYVHFECLISQMMWSNHNHQETLWRLLPNRDTIVPIYYSIQAVPEKASWLLGLGFSNPKRQIIKGLQKSGKYSGIFDRMICGETL
jgi:DNA-directed RNA polymerase subunit beta'